MLRGKVDPKKEEQDRLQGFLLEMLKEEENKYCADCQAKTPRWAAWNLGIFICIRCAGIHRNLGVHISKVRSVNLDSWTAEQVQTMRVWGNEKARQVYEHDLPAQFRRPTNDQQMEQFIRSKYEQKRYMLRDFEPPKVNVNDLPKSLTQIQKKCGTPVVSIATRGNAVVTTNGHSAASLAPSLLDFSDPPASSTPAQKVTNLFDDFDGLSLQSSAPAAAPALAQSAANDDFDDFGSFVSASAQSAAPSASVGGFADFSSAVSTNSHAPAASSGLSDLTNFTPAGNENGKKKTNADILSLFGTSGGLAAPSVVAPGGFAGFGLQAAPQQPQTSHQNAFAAFGAAPAPVQQQMAPPQNDLYSGLSGINFGGLSTQQNPVPLQSFGTSFGATQSSFGGTTSPSFSARATPTSPTASQGFNIPNKINAFADLALGKVMKTNYGQNALHATSTPSANQTSPLPMTTPPMMTTSSTNAVNNDLFDMFATAPPPVPVAANSSSGLDDLLGL
ncbi:unnamed protein product [Caenorhabditis sp. 36 PRJEB53466]|nr:unnamed protein product [Caenorhabditis sp. 36 PRJEB53466]